LVRGLDKQVVGFESLSAEQGASRCEVGVLAGFEQELNGLVDVLEVVGFRVAHIGAVELLGN